MEAKDLRIGNFVTRKGVVNYVQNFLEVCSIEESNINTKYWSKVDESFVVVRYKQNYDPIPLTEEWLIKFGFEKSSLKYWILPNKNFYFGISLKMGAMYLFDEGMITPSNIKHVHQLQNLYFALTGKELSINQN